MLLYNALVSSYLRYAVPACSSSTLLGNIQTAQNRILRTILFKYSDTDISSGYTQLKILDVESIYAHEVTKLIHSVYYQYCPEVFSNFFERSTHTYSTRLNQNTYYKAIKTKTIQSSFQELNNGTNYPLT